MFKHMPDSESDLPQRKSLEQFGDPRSTTSTRSIKKEYDRGSWENTHYLLPTRDLTLNNYVEILILVNSCKQRIILSSWMISSLSNGDSNMAEYVPWITSPIE